jgi:hypothetical protein
VGSNSVAARVREKVLASRGRFWRPEDFSECSPGAVTRTLVRLERGGELCRVRRGLYWRGASTPLGMAPPPVSRLIKVLAPSLGTGPAGRSAALMLGLSTQVPRCETFAVPARAPAGTETLHFVSRAAQVRRKSARLSPAEVALLEVLRDWDGLVESPAEAPSRIAGLMDSGELRADRVVMAALTEPPAVRERLRSIFGIIGRPELAAKVSPARSKPAALAP